MKTLLLPGDLGQAVINYLKKQPYDEVFTLIAAMMQLKEATPIPPAVVPKKKGEPEA